MTVLYGVLGGAVAGALGGAIGWGITALVWADREPAERPRWLAVACVALMVALSRPVVHSLEQPSVQDALRQAEQEYPALAALRETDSSAYSEVQSAAQLTQSGAISEAEGMERVHAALMKSYQRKLPNAPDALVQLNAQLVSAEYSALEGSPDICVNYIAGTQMVDLRQYLSPNLLASDQDMIARVLRSHSTDPVAVASEADVLRATEPIILRIQNDENITASQMTDALQMRGDHRRICRIYAALFQHLSELPTPQAAAVTRGLSRMGEGSS